MHVVNNAVPANTVFRLRIVTFFAGIEEFKLSDMILIDCLLNKIQVT